MCMLFQFDLETVDTDDASKFNLKLFDFIKNKTIQTKWQKNLEHKAWNSLFLCNHNQPRPVSGYGSDSLEYKKIVKLFQLR